MANCNIEIVTSAIDYIEANLTEKLDLNMVADAVNYSKFHLHRMFLKPLALLCTTTSKDVS